MHQSTSDRLTVVALEEGGACYTFVGYDRHRRYFVWETQHERIY